MKKRKKSRKREQVLSPRTGCPQCGVSNARTDAACSACGAPLDRAGAEAPDQVSRRAKQVALPEGEPPTIEPGWWPARREPSVVTLWLSILLATASAVLAFAFRSSQFDLAVAILIFLASSIAIYQTQKWPGSGRKMSASEEAGRFAMRILQNVGIIFGLFLALVLSPLILLVVICMKAIS
jgi:hypothetical protein